MNKLAEEILKKHIATIIKTGDKEYDDFYRKSIVLQAMQEYHEAKLKQITDEDIDVHIIEHYELKSVPFCLGFTNGAKAFRNGEIKHIDA